MNYQTSSSELQDYPSLRGKGSKLGQMDGHTNTAHRSKRIEMPNIHFIPKQFCPDYQRTSTN